jgi:hypothetical protein
MYMPDLESEDEAVEAAAAAQECAEDCAEDCAEAPAVLPAAAFARLAPEEQAARRALHEEEVRARLSWCLERGLAPASEHVHRAPGNDANFMFAEPPWLPDGSVNPRGVPFGRAEDRLLDKHRQLEDFSAAGWSCRKCQARVRAAPREWNCRSAEPVDWWWCTACKLALAAKDAHKTSAQKKLAQAARGCRRLDVAWFGASGASGASGGST